MMIVNETKNGMVCRSATRDIYVRFNDMVLDVFEQNNYLGNLMKSMKTLTKDVFLAETIKTYAIKPDKQSLQCLDD